MGSVGCLAKGDIFFWQNILKNRSKYRGDISEQSVVCTALISAIIIEIFRKNIPVSYIIPYKKLASPLIPVCLRKSHMERHIYLATLKVYKNAKTLALRGAKKSVTEILIGEKEKWTNKSNDKNEEADSLLHNYKKSYPTFVLNFEIIDTVVPEKSLTKTGVRAGKKKIGKRWQK